MEVFKLLIENYEKAFLRDASFKTVTDTLNLLIEFLLVIKKNWNNIFWIVKY